MKKYSVLTYNFNHYETFYEPKEVDDECEYIYVTDDESIKSNVWKVIVDHNLDKLPVFDKVFTVRYNLFNYCTTPICINIDGSVIIHKSLHKLYEDFEKSGCELGLNIHPYKNNIPYEYACWVNYRNYPAQMANRWLNVMANFGYDFNKKGLVQLTFRIERNTDIVKKINNHVFTLMQSMNDPYYTERLDQTVYSFVLQHYYEYFDSKIFPLSQQVIQNDYMTWTLHDPSQIVMTVPEPEKPLYLFDKLHNLYLLKD